MADDQGLVADIESDIVNKLTAISLGGNTVFRTVDNWRFQIVSADSFRAYSPFAFVEYDGTARYDWEGNHDLGQRLVFTIRVGTEITQHNNGAARIGVGVDASKYQLGISRLRDLVINALQWQLAITSDARTERYEYLGDDLVWSLPDQAALMMRFQVDRVG